MGASKIVQCGPPSEVGLCAASDQASLEGSESEGSVEPGVSGVERSSTEESLAWEEPGHRRPLASPVLSEQVEHGGGEPDGAGLVALSVSDVQELGGRIDVAALQRPGLGGAEATGVDQREQGSVEGALGGFEQGADLLEGECGSGLGPSELGARHIGHDLGPPQGRRVQEPQRRPVHEHGGRCPAELAQPQQELAHVRGPEFCWRAAVELGIPLNAPLILPLRGQHQASHLRRRRRHCDARAIGSSTPASTRRP